MRTLPNIGILAFQLAPALLTFSYIVMQGPLLAAAMLVGGTVAVFHLARRGRYDWLKYCLPLFISVSIYAVLAFYWRELVDLYVFHYAILGVYYAVPTGVLVFELVRDGYDREVELAFVASALFLSLVAVVVVRTTGVDTLTIIRDGELFRANPGSEVQYLGFFRMENIIMGTVPFVLFALAGCPLYLGKSLLASKVALAVGIAAGTWVGLQTTTRSAFASGTVSFAITLPILLRSLNMKARTKGLLLLLSVGPFFLQAGWERNLYFQGLVERFRAVDQDLRIAVWKESIGLILNKPFGGGLEHLSVHRWAHNYLLDAGLTTGIAGVFALGFSTIWVLWQSANQVIRWKRTPSAIHRMLFSQLIAVFFVSNLSPPTLAYMVFIYLVGGFMAAANLRQRRPTAGSRSAANGRWDDQEITQGANASTERERGALWAPEQEHRT